MGGAICPSERSPVAHLVEQGLEEVVIDSVDEGYFDRCRA